MNKRLIPGIIIVEGIHDKERLSHLYNSCFVLTHGYAINKKDIIFLNSVDCRVLCAVDSDTAGKEIEHKIICSVPKAIIVNVDINKCSHKNKHGLAECDFDEIKKKFDKYCSDEEYNFITKQELFKLGLIGDEESKERRHLICDKFNLGFCSSKDMLSRLNIKKITYTQIKELLDGRERNN